MRIHDIGSRGERSDDWPTYVTEMRLTHYFIMIR